MMVIVVTVSKVSSWITSLKVRIWDQTTPIGYNSIVSVLQRVRKPGGGVRTVINEIVIRMVLNKPGEDILQSLQSVTSHIR